MRRAILAVVGMSVIVTSCRNASSSLVTRVTVTPSVVKPLSTLAIHGLRKWYWNSQGGGWALTGHHLYRILSGGSMWIDTTPPGAVGPSVSADFMSSSQALVAWITLPSSYAASNARVLTIASTADAGQHWAIHHFHTKMFSPISGTYVDFLSAQREWVLAQEQHGMGSNPGVLWLTSDGGRHFIQVASGSFTQGSGTLPVAGPIRFRSSTVGWLLGDTASTLPNSLYMTSNAGSTWTQVIFSGLASSQTSTYSVLALPHFFPGDGLQGVLPLQVVPNSHRTSQYRLVIAHTEDGGSSWTTTAPVSAPINATVQFYTPLFGWMWSSQGSHFSLQATINGGQSWQLVSTRQLSGVLARSHGVIKAINWISRTKGWALWGNPQGQMGLLRTTDGGAYWTSVQVHKGS